MMQHYATVTILLTNRSKCVHIMWLFYTPMNHFINEPLATAVLRDCCLNLLIGTVFTNSSSSKKSTRGNFATGQSSSQIHNAQVTSKLETHCIYCRSIICPKPLTCGNILQFMCLCICALHLKALEKNIGLYNENLFSQNCSSSVS